MNVKNLEKLGMTYKLMYSEVSKNRRKKVHDDHNNVKENTERLPNSDPCNIQL